MDQGEALKNIWQRTKLRHNELEKGIVENYINFLRKVAVYYLKKGRRVFFKENRVVHWGEWDFGSLLIEGPEDVIDVFGDYVSEIRFAPKVEEIIRKEGHVEVHPGNLNIIHYRVEEL